MRALRYSSSAVLTLALQSMLLPSNAAAQEAPLPMGRTIGDACTRSVTLPAPAPGAMRGPGPAGGPGPAVGPGLAGGPPAGAFPAPPPSAEAPTRLVKVTDDVYAIINVNDAVMPDIPLYGGNVAVYLTDDGVVLVDAKTDGMHDDLVAKVASLTDKPIKYVVLTHNHADHSGGAAKLQALGATVVASAANREHMAAAGQPGLPEVSYEGHARIVLGDKRIELLEFCGHTSGDTVVYLPDARVLVAGDLVTTPASIPQIANYADGGNWTDMVRAVETLAEFDFDFMIAGHGPVLTKQQFLEHRDRIAAIRARAQELVRDGKSQAEIAETLTAEFDWGSGFAGQNIPGMMIELR